MSSNMDANQLYSLNSTCSTSLLSFGAALIFIYLIVNYIFSENKLYFWNTYHAKGILIVLTCLLFAIMILSFYCQKGTDVANLSIIIWLITAVGGLAFAFVLYNSMQIQYSERK